MTVLLVDDDPAIREVLRRLLVRDFGVQVVEASDGLTALQRLLSEPVALVVLDLAMPGMGGIATLESIRRSPTYATLPVVVLSGQTDQPRVVRAGQLGVTAFIAKPFTIVSLRERLRPLLAGVRTTATADTARPLLDLGPAQRALVLDTQPELRAFVRDRLSEVCPVDEAEDETSAAALAQDTAYHAIFVGTTDPPVQLALFRDRMSRQGRTSPHVIAVAPSSDLETLRASNRCDAVVVRSFVADTFDRSLSQVVGPTTRARLLFSGGAPSVIALFDLVRAEWEALLGSPVALDAWRSGADGGGRWVSVAVEIQSAGLAWDLRLGAPLMSALTWAGSRLHLHRDQVSESELLRVTGLFASELAEALRTDVGERGLASTQGAARAGIVRADAGPQPEAGRGAARWLSTARDQPALTVQLAPLASRPT